MSIATLDFVAPNDTQARVTGGRAEMNNGGNGDLARPWKIEEVLYPGGQLATVAQLQQDCAERLTALICGLTSWVEGEFGKTWTASDSGFLVVWFDIDKDAEGYIQLLSHPTEPESLWEVASSDYSPELATVLNEARLARIADAGFTKPSDKSNFQRRVRIASAEDASTVASESLRLLVEVFGYDGAAPLHIRSVAERAARRRLLHERLNPKELRLMLTHWGYMSELVDAGEADEPPTIVLRSGGIPWYISASERADHGWGYEQFSCDVLLSRREGIPAVLLRRWNRREPFVHAHAEKEGAVRLSLTLPLWLGLSERYLRTMVGHFDRSIDRFRDAVQCGVIE